MNLHSVLDSICPVAHLLGNYLLGNGTVTVTDLGGSETMTGTKCSFGRARNHHQSSLSGVTLIGGTGEVTKKSSKS